MVVGSRRWIDSATAHMIWDRELETAPPADVRALAEAAWQSQLAHLRENSAFHRPNLGSGALRLADLTGLPFTTKEDLKRAIEANPPFGSNLCVPEARVKRVYQTSGTTGAPSVLALTLADHGVWTDARTRRHQQGMHFCGTGHVWPELVDPDSRQPMEIETGAVGELVYTHLTRQAMPMLRFLGGDIVRIEGTSCECGRTSFRMRCLGRRDDMFIVRGVNVYPSAILAVVGDFRPRVTGRARVVRTGDATSIEPPIPVEVEITERHESDVALVAQIESAIHSRLMFRSKVELVPESDFGESGYKTKLTVRK